MTDLEIIAYSAIGGLAFAIAVKALAYFLPKDFL